MNRILKRCPRCGEDKEGSLNFYKDKNRKDGLSCWCKACNMERQRTDNGRLVHARGNKKYNNTEKGRIALAMRKKRYRSTERGKQAHRKIAATQRKKFPENIRARKSAQAHIPMRNCQYPDCRHSESRLERHHWDYSKPLDVVTLCRKH